MKLMPTFIQELNYIFIFSKFLNNKFSFDTNDIIHYQFQQVDEIILKITFLRTLLIGKRKDNPYIYRLELSDVPKLRRLII